MSNLSRKGAIKHQGAGIELFRGFRKTINHQSRRRLDKSLHPILLEVITITNKDKKPIERKQGVNQ